MPKEKPDKPVSERDPLNTADLLDQFAVGMRRQGLSYKRIASTLMISEERAKNACETQRAENADASGKALKEALPAALRAGAFHLLAEAMRPEKVAEANLRDLMVAAGIMIDKASVLDSGGELRGISILVQLQSRVDQSEMVRLLGHSAGQAIEAETVEPVPVQACPPSLPEKDAPPKRRPGRPRKQLP